MIVNVRGTHGSGKTTISRRFIDEHPHEELHGPPPAENPEKRYVKPIAFRLEGDLYMVGRKQAGCDGIHPQTIIEDLIRHYAARGHVIFENVLVSANVGRWGRLVEELEPVNHSVWAFLDTPFEKCLERVYERRRARAAEGWKHRNPEGIKEDVMAAHFRRVHASARNAALQGIDVRYVNHEYAYELIHDMLIHHAGWECKTHGLLLPHVPPLQPWIPDPQDPQNAQSRAARRTKAVSAAAPESLPQVEPSPGTITVDEEWDLDTWE